MGDFFRKEKNELFLQRFSQDPQTGAWSLKAPFVIFKAKSPGKIFSVKGVRVTVKTELSGYALSFSFPDGRKTVKATLGEDDMGDMLDKTSDSYKSASPILRAAVAELCRLHATCSTNSPLISGCVVDNFAASKSYPGRKLHLELKSRSPFGNPLVSGMEKENFLIHQVTAADCDKIWYQGKTDEDLQVQVTVAR